MTHSIVAVGDRHFVSTDMNLTAAVLFMKSVYMESIKDRLSDSRPLVDYFASVERTIEYGGAGCIRMNLGALFESCSNKRIFSALVDDSLSSLDEFKENVPAEYLNSVSDGVSREFYDFPVEILRGELLKFKSVL